MEGLQEEFQKSGIKGGWVERLRRWDDKERRDSNREESKRKIGKIMLISSLIGLAFYLAYLIPDFVPNSFGFVK